MLTNLIVNNFALIKNLEVEFDNNLNVISGETGSGKSLLMKALKFVLGDRADKANIRSGENLLKVQCILDRVNDKAINVLNEIGVEQDDSEPIIISRTLTIDGKSDIRINGNLTTLSNLNKFTKCIVDFYGQQEHFSLLENSKQLDVVDNYFANETNSIKQSLHNHLSQRNDLIKKLNSNYGDEENKKNKIELLEYQIKELEENNFKDEYEQDLRDKKNRYLSFEKIKENIENALTILNNGYNSSSLSNGLKEVSTSLKNISKFDNSFDELLEKSDNMRYDLEDLEYQISTIYNNQYSEMINIDEIESELDRVKLIKNKYGICQADREQFLENCKSDLDFIVNNDKIVEKLKKELEIVNDTLLNDCKELYSIRCKAIDEIEKNISKNFKDLEMKNATFKIEHNVVNDINEVTSNGYDSIEFLLSSNLGQPLKPLSKIISGGELSRFMLAYKNVMMQKDEIELMILDEIDSGISGVVAEKVAYKLSDLTKYCQIISISHLPQIVSIADKNLKIYKETNNNETYTMLSVLNDDSLYREIARLSGSKELKDLDLEYAKQLKSVFNSYKK